MRKPSEYVAAARKRLFDGQLSGCLETLRHGERAAKVTRIGSTSRGEDAVAETDVFEQCRVLASASDFPRLSKGSAVELGDTVRVVTSASADITKTLLTVGLSAEFEKCPAAYKGTRREDGGVRTLDFPLDVLLLESGTADGITDAAAPSIVPTYIVAIRREDWCDETTPNFGDELTAAKDGVPIAIKVLSAERSDGWYILKCRDTRRRQW